VHRLGCCVLTAAVAAALIAAPGEGRSSRALETITISNTSQTPVETETVLQEDDEYRLTVTGTVSDWCAPTAKSGHECSNGSPFVKGAGVDGVWCYAKWRCPDPQAWQQLSINGKGILDFAGLTPDDKPYSPSHTYSIEFDGVSGKLSLGAADALAGSTSDNSGSFTVTLVDPGPAGGSGGKLTYTMPDRSGRSAPTG
jgi:hypothetical protein